MEKSQNGGTKSAYTPKKFGAVWVQCFQCTGPIEIVTYI